MAAFVVDLGSYRTKSGFAGDVSPWMVCNTTSNDGLFFMEHGYVKNFDGFEAFMNNFVANNQIDFSDGKPILITESALNPTTNTEKMAQILFETFGVKKLFVGLKPIMSMVGTGRESGLNVHCGDGVTVVTPIDQLLAKKFATQRVNVGGRHLVQYLLKLLQRSGAPYLNPYDPVVFEVARSMAHSVGFVAMNVQDAHALITETTYTLPDGSSVTLDKERFTFTEPLFTPDFLCSRNRDSLQQLIKTSIEHSDSSLHNVLSQNIVLTGGVCMYNGFSDRLQSEISRTLGESSLAQVTAQSNTTETIWKGASLFASRSQFESMCYSESDYNEMGPSGVHSKIQNYSAPLLY